MWQSRRYDPDPLAVLGVVLVQILFALYGFYTSIWGLAQGFERHYFGMLTLIVSAVAAVDLVLLVAASALFIKIKARRTGVGWKRMKKYLLLEGIFCIGTVWLVFGPWLDALGWD